jgi:hypothetical protein
MGKPPLRLVTPPVVFPIFTESLAERLAEELWHASMLAWRMEGEIGAATWASLSDASKIVYRDLARVAYVQLAIEGGGVAEVLGATRKKR